MLAFEEARLSLDFVEALSGSRVDVLGRTAGILWAGSHI